MAGDSIVGALRVVLGMDTASYEDGAKKAGEATQSFGKRVAEIAAGIGLEKVVERAKDAFIDFGKVALETAGSLYKLSQKTGIPVDQLSGLGHAAALTGVDLEGLVRGIKTMQIELTKAGSNAITPAASAIQYLGLNVKQIANSQPQEAFLKITDAVNGLADGTNKAAVVSAIFGKKFGSDLIPLLNEGRDGIEHMIESAKGLGLVISGDTAKNAETFNQKMLELGKVVNGIALQALGPLSQGLANVSTRLIDFVNHSNLVAKAAQGIVTAFALLIDNLNVIVGLLAVFIARMAITALVNFAGAVLTIIKTLSSLTAVLQLFNIANLLTLARFTAMAALFIYVTGNMDDFVKTVKAVGGAVASLLPDDTTKQITEGLKSIGIDISALEGNLKGVKPQINDTTSELNELAKTAKLPQVKTPLFDPEAAKKLQDFNNELRKLGLQSREVSGEFLGTLAPGFIQAAQSLKLIKDDGSNLNSVLALTTQRSQQLNAALLTLEGAKLTQEFLTPWQTFEQQMQRINLLLQQGKINQDTFVQASIKQTTTMAAAYGQAAATIAGGFADAFKIISEHNKKFAGVAKAAAIAAALANTFVAANKAMAETPGGLPFQIAAAAAVTAAGLANVAKIAMTDFQTGGTFKVGGAGGIDSQVISFRASPGEMVDVRKPGNVGKSGEVTVRGIGSRDFFTGDMLREMVRGLNEAYADGYKLKFAE
jgi:hypothetical protein